jgi:hypothetical protein
MSGWSALSLREDCGFSRTQFLRRGAAVVGGVAGLGLTGTATAGGRPSADPRPIPGGLLIDQNFNITVVPANPTVHVAPPAIGFELSTITDFNGSVGAAEIQGTARGSDGSTYTFDADMRFMQGVYVAMDGRLRQGSFGFV